MMKLIVERQKKMSAIETAAFEQAIGAVGRETLIAMAR
jgi:hypothetical protein